MKSPAGYSWMSNTSAIGSEGPSRRTRRNPARDTARSVERKQWRHALGPIAPRDVEPARPGSDQRAGATTTRRPTPPGRRSALQRTQGATAQVGTIRNPSCSTQVARRRGRPDSGRTQRTRRSWPHASTAAACETSRTSGPRKRRPGTSTAPDHRSRETDDAAANPVWLSRPAVNSTRYILRGLLSARHQRHVVADDIRDHTGEQRVVGAAKHESRPRRPSADRGSRGLPRATPGPEVMPASTNSTNNGHACELSRMWALRQRHRHTHRW